MHARDRERGSHGGLAVLALAMALGPAAAAPAAAPFFVNDPLTDVGDQNPGDGVCASARGTCTLRTAFEEANADPGCDTIVLQQLAVPQTRLVLAQPIAVRTPVILASEACNGSTVACDDTAVGDACVASSTMVLDGGAATQLFEVGSGGALTIRGVMLEKGKPGATAVCGGAGGAICNAGGTLVLEKSVVQGCEATKGAAIHGPVTLRDSVVKDNASLTVGGGITADGGEVVIERSTITGNTASTSGGGVWMSGAARLEMRRTTVDGNGAGAGGGMWFANVPLLEISNTTVSGNTATHGAGGIQIAGTVAPSGLLNNVTITRNRVTEADGNAGGIELGSDGAALEVRNSIIADNAGGNCDGVFMPGGHNLFQTDTECGYDESRGDVVGAPQLGALAFDDDGPGTGIHQPMAGSPAIDRGAACEPDDQRGLSRACEPNVLCDIGAAELHPDTDQDGRRDCAPEDNCPMTANRDQADRDGDLVGDACDDGDGDGIVDLCDRCDTGPGSEGDPVFRDGCPLDAQCPCDAAPVQSHPGRAAGRCPRDIGPTGDGPEAGATRPWRNRRQWVRCVARSLRRAMVAPVGRPAVITSESQVCAVTGSTITADLRRTLMRQMKEMHPPGECPTSVADDDDRDGDGIANAEDNCPGVYNALQRNTDVAWRDNEWCNDDGDCPEQPQARRRKWYADGRGDHCDPDDDGDRFPDGDDNCRNVPSKNNRDIDGDECGDVCDPDMDGDGRPNDEDPCPENPSRLCQVTTSTTTVSTTSTVTSTTAP